MIDHRQHNDIADECTVIAVMCLQMFDLFSCRVDIFDAFPFVRRLVGADGYRITVDIGLVNAQAEAVYTVTTVAGDEAIDIFAGSVQQFRTECHTALDMFPFVRQFRIRDIYNLMFEIFRIHIETQLDDTVAAVLMTGQRVVVCTALGQETQLVQFGQTKAQRVALTDRIKENRVLDNRQHIDMYVADTVISLRS